MNTSTRRAINNARAMAKETLKQHEQQLRSNDAAQTKEQLENFLNKHTNRLTDESSNALTMAISALNAIEKGI